MSDLYTVHSVCLSRSVTLFLFLPQVYLSLSVSGLSVPVCLIPCLTPVSFIFHVFAEAYVSN